MVLVDNEDVRLGLFPNNEVEYRDFKSRIEHGLNLQCSSGFVKVKLIFESNADLTDLAIAKKAIDDIYGGRDITTILHIPFFMYSQMDRQIEGKLFSLKYVAKFINDLKFDKVEIFDPHSNVLPALLNNVRVHYPVTTFVNNPGAYHRDINYDLLFYPDNGAAKKYSELLPHHKYRFGNKKRNLETGEIIEYEVIADREDIEGKSILIVDDLCMGGRTFKEAANALRKMGAHHIDLYVTHLMKQAREFYRTRGNGSIDTIYSYDSLNNIPTFLTPEPTLEPTMNLSGFLPNTNA